MVQTVMVSEATLVDDITAFLLEDPDTINCASNWWHPRVKVLEKWLREDANRAAIPDDGMEEMVRRLIQRGDIYTQSQLKCWKHILLELCDIPSLSMASSVMDPTESVASPSPSRGKLRPGKELIILSDELNQETASAEDAPLILPDEGSSAPKCSPQRTLVAAPTSTTASSKKLANLSMMERQAEWLRKKEEKLAAEKLRQDEEKQKELTFQPKLIRRSTFNNNGERPTQEERQPPSARSAIVVRSDSVGVNAKSEPTASTQETRRPPSGNISTRRGSAKTNKKKKSIPVDQRLEVQSDLLESMKIELEASMQRTAPLPRHATRSSEAEHDDEASNNHVGDPSSGPDVSLTNEAFGQHVARLELQSWQACPIIGGFRVDFDSSDTKARLVLQDASRFELSSMYRKTDRKAQRDGVALHMGRREDTYEEEVIAILFDKEKVSESDATAWWKDHAHRFAHYSRDRSASASSHALASAVAALSTAL